MIFFPREINGGLGCITSYKEVIDPSEVDGEDLIGRLAWI